MNMMTLSEKRVSFMFTVLVSIIGGFSIYFVLRYLHMHQQITIPLAVIISLLLFALTRYYSGPISNYDTVSNDDYTEGRANPKEWHQGSRSHSSGQSNSENGKLSSTDSPVKLSHFLFFVVIYSAILAVSGVSRPDSNIFTSWASIGPAGFIQLGAAIILAFFIPGYALMLMLTERCKLGNILKVVFAYLTSILITGLTSYISATSFDVSIVDVKNILTSVYLTILISFIIFYWLKNKDRIKFKIKLRSTPQSSSYTRKSGLFLILPSQRLDKIKKSIVAKNSELIAFASLFSLLIIFTYYTYGGITIGDQWYHQGRAITISSGSFRQAVLAGAESEYPPFQSALISGLTSLSGIPLVNTYASIAFLNIIPLFGFYYFYSKWVPPDMRKAALLACSIFMLASGFGWIYLTNMAATSAHDTIDSEHSAVLTIDSMRSYILMPSNFILASHPDFSTALIYIALPSGLVLLGISRQLLQNKALKTSVVAIIAVTGILSHEEFYFFIIVTSLTLLIFRIKEANYVYVGILLALFAISAINYVAPQNYYTFTELFGIPLLYLCILFVSITWTLYMALQSSKISKAIPKLGLATEEKWISLDFLKSRICVLKSNRKIRILVLLSATFVTAIAYISSFVILAPISLHDVNDEALRGVVPWYQYPMKLGLMGLLGIAFIVSYLFKRFEKEVFIFGIIIVIAILTGPYYDQHRFSKYVMIGMIGFASLLVYKVLDFRFKYRSIVNPVIITAFVITASLSTLVFVGYNSLAFENHEYVHDLGRRNFPTESELKLLDAVLPNTEITSKRYNVISTPNEYNFFKGTLLTKLSSFDGMPPGKLLQGRFVLNVTSLDALYRLLDYSDARFIIIPKEDIMNESRLTQPVRFALDSFVHFYEDDKYVVLEVPDLNSSSYSGSQDVAFVYDENRNGISSRSTFNTTLIEYNDKIFNSDQLRQLKNLHHTGDVNSKTYNTVICDSKPNEGITVWSKGFDEIAGPDINYLEVSFKIDSFNSNGWTDTGLRWNEGDKQYYTSVTKNGLELSQKTIGNNGRGEIDKKLLYQNNEVQQRKDVWYTLKIKSLKNSLNVYVDDILKAKTIRNAEKYGDAGITKVGISCFNDDVKFSEIKIGTVKLPQNETTAESKTIYEYGYPLSILALSNTGYETFVDADLSALSKQIVILSFDPLEWKDDRFNLYMQYVKQGGILVVINSDTNLKGQFSDLFWMDNKVGENKTRFTTIGIGDDIANISGWVYPLSANQSDNASIIASYVDNTGNSIREVAPFALEKNFTNGGKIILINSGAYFDALAKSPGNFTSLSKVLSALDLRLPHAPLLSPTSQPPEHFVGNMAISGNVTLTSSSLLMPHEHDENNETEYDDSQGRITKAQEIKIYEDRKLKHTFEKAPIKYLKLVGDYRVTINSKDLKLPYMTSQSNYIGVAMPKFNMTINLSDYPLSSAQLAIHNPNTGSHEVVDVGPGSTIKFDNMESRLNISGADVTSELTFTHILLKEPEIESDGNAKYTMLRFPWHYLEKVQYKAENLKTRLGYVDEYSEPLSNGMKIQYITLMNSTANQ